jgi:hypothetical protein
MQTLFPTAARTHRAPLRQRAGQTRFDPHGAVVGLAERTRRDAATDGVDVAAPGEVFAFSDDAVHQIRPRNHAGSFDSGLLQTVPRRVRPRLLRRDHFVESGPDGSGCTATTTGRCACHPTQSNRTVLHGPQLERGAPPDAASPWPAPRCAFLRGSRAGATLDSPIDQYPA